MEKLSDSEGVVWGAAAIGAEIGQSPAKTFYLLEKGLIPGRKVGRRWTSTRRQLRERIAGPDQPRTAQA